MAGTACFINTIPPSLALAGGGGGGCGGRGRVNMAWRLGWRQGMTADVTSVTFGHPATIAPAIGNTQKHLVFK